MFKQNDRNTTDQLFSINIHEKRYECNITMYQLFVDYKQAFDGVNREKLKKVLIEYCVPPKIMRLTRLVLKEPRSGVKIRGQLSGEFQINEVVRQKECCRPCYLNSACIQ